MSTILDSLKKSSDQRDDNNKSSINNFSFGGDNKTKNKHTRLIILVLILLLIVVAYWGYLTYFSDENTGVAGVETTTAIESNNKNEAENHALKTKTPENKKPKPNSQEVKQQLKTLNKQQQTQKLADLNKVQKNSRNNPIENPLNEPIKPLEQLKKAEPAVQVSEMEKPQAIEKKAVKKPIKEQRNYLLAYELPFSIRKDLPKLKLNIHVFDKDPVNRIVILNGIKYAINDMMEEEILIKDIVKDGVLLEFGDIEFLIPKL